MPRLNVLPKCPNCGKELDGYTGPIRPRAGDVTVCVYCTTPSEFLEGLDRLRMVDMTQIGSSLKRDIEAAIAQVRQIQAKMRAMKS